MNQRLDNSQKFIKDKRKLILFYFLNFFINSYIQVKMIFEIMRSLIPVQKVPRNHIYHTIADIAAFMIKTGIFDHVLFLTKVTFFVRLNKG